ncbi:MAG TPA: hypothetical protein VH251_01120 [Verrucomicrobiae bacterium]|jgi:hypothetical protein|nr:hypothetical protein [Verrucomicrobiae bacterium]
MTTTLTKAPQKKLGRPEKFDAKTRRRLVAAIGSGIPICHAVAACRVSKSGFHDYKNSHPKFAEQIDRAVGKAVEWHLNNIIAAAKNGDVQSSRWFLERTQPAHFGRTKIELTGADGQPLAAAVGIYLPQKDAPEIKPAVITT